MIKLFDKEKDYKTIAKWWLEHDQIPCRIDLLPNIGYIVDDMVVGFLYLTDSKVCFFESIVSKKNSDKEQRREALDKLIDVIVNSAQEMGYENLIFHTLNPRLKDEVSKKWNCIQAEGSTERFYKDLRSQS